MSVLVGRPAPDFTATAVMGDGSIRDDFRLSDYKGSKYVALFFWPLDFTFVCPSEIIAHEKRRQAFEERGVQVGVRIRGAEQVARLEQLAMPRESRTEPLGSRLVDPLGGQAHGEPLEHGARLEDLDRLAVRYLAHARTAVRLPDDEALLLEPDEGVPDGAARHVERRHDVRLHESRVRRDLAAHDRLAKLLVVRVGVGRQSAHGRLPAKSSTCSPK